MNIDANALTTVVTILTSAGGITLVTQLFRARSTIKTGALSSTRAVVRDLVEARNEAEDRLDRQTRRADFWQSTAGNYAYQLRKAGFTPDPENPVPPELTVVAKAAARRKRDRDRDDDRLGDTGDILS